MDPSLVTAIEAALLQDWQGAHAIVQERDEPLACWIHAILHKIEGDAWNSRYWYARSGGRKYDDYDDPRLELAASLAAASTPTAEK